MDESSLHVSPDTSYPSVVWPTDPGVGWTLVTTTTKRGIRVDRAARAKQARVVQAISELGFPLPGSVEVRRTRCGKANCRCKADSPQLHGPYIVWTRKVEGKTVTRVLTPEQLEDYRPLMDNAKRLRDLVTQLQDLTLEVLDSDDRWRTR